MELNLQWYCPAKGFRAKKNYKTHKETRTLYSHIMFSFWLQPKRIFAHCEIQSVCLYSGLNPTFKLILSYIYIAGQRRQFLIFQVICLSHLVPFSLSGSIVSLKALFSNTSNTEEFPHPGYDVMSSVENQQTFRKYMRPPLSGSKNKQSRVLLPVSRWCIA
jgi:hypothetical protein